MKVALRLLLLSYLPIVVTFATIDFYSDAFRPELSPDEALFHRAGVALLGSVTFRSPAFAASWTDVGLAARSGGAASLGDIAQYLTGVLFIGFLEMCALQIPTYLYAWVRGEKRIWSRRGFKLDWRRPAFRDLVRALHYGLLVAAIAVAVWQVPVLAAVFFALGGYLAIRQPMLLNYPLNFVETYEIAAPGPLVKLFGSDEIQAARETKEEVPAAASTPQTAQRKPNTVEPKRARSSEKWFDRVNR